MKKISVDDIARSTYLSTTYITKIYKEVTGDTPINYLINLRLEKARELDKAKYADERTTRLDAKPVEPEQPAEEKPAEQPEASQDKPQE